ncbi:MAG: type II toxin-antitoxin system VapC family toxin [Gemmatimonadetes bacterium]|nr:type II toxin-antitoxin system VapC family toxin [Gemmatimonadota bacterium]MXX70528.1 type II toxin-antitoxin system VapC family toxin [Gemmatimonadota bacterium]MYB05755.1 type II toxin-antitoxin system VapC family toxin [Gemmatimonadota bacterium]MYC92969.1 type II toxin-antitoxin system VapC family toxin [Gemmatimonadota bacterium]MYE15615.1 type II toxin-antitoxin system VapC family toxin [Gemmatimonadota bacterium]
MIASVALADGAAVATTNTADFQRLGEFGVTLAR